MHTATEGRWAWVLLLLALLGAPGLRAQPGAPLREVTRLARVAEPPGGLIPYRAGKLWGYADTTGRVVIRPCLENEPYGADFFTRGFVLVSPYVQAASLPPAREASDYRLAILNARGEVLRVRWSEAAVAQPDGSLQLVSRWRAYGQLEPAPLDSAARSGFSDWGLRRVVPDRRDEPEPGLGDSLRYQARLLGAHRGTRADFPFHSGRAASDNVRTYPRTQGLYALTDRQGRLLTGYRFVSIDSFYEGRARVRLPIWHYLVPPRRAAPYSYSNVADNVTGFIDTLGVFMPTPPPTAFRHGRAVVFYSGTEPDSAFGMRYGIIDRAGHYEVPLQYAALSVPDAEGYIRVLGERQRYLAPPGQPSLVGQVFTHAGPFGQGRARAQRGSRIGLIDARGRWVTRRAYQQLIEPPQLRYRTWMYGGEYQRDYLAASNFALDANGHYRSSPEDAASYGHPAFLRVRFPAADPAYLVAQRGGKYGLVARRSGRETVPARYDSVLFNPYRGLACLRRAGQPYVVAVASGRELAAAEYGGIDFLTPRGERLRYLTRPAPAAWALLDTLGRLRTPWVPGTGYPTPQGWLLSHEPEGYTLRDSTGRLAYRSRFAITSPQWDPIWDEVQMLYWHARTNWRFQATPTWLLPLRPDPHPDTPVAFAVADSLHPRLLDARLHELARLPAGAVALRSGWAWQVEEGHVGHLGYQGYRDYQAYQLYSDTGQRLPAPPPGTQWLSPGVLNYPRAWHQHGVLPTTQGYVTRGGRKLWEQ